ACAALGSECGMAMVPVRWQSCAWKNPSSRAAKGVPSGMRLRRAKITFATNRRIRGLWQTTIPSRFLDDLPADHVEVVEAPGASTYGGYGVSRFENMDTYASSYATPGWQRAQARRNAGGNGGDRCGFS